MDPSKILSWLIERTPKAAGALLVFCLSALVLSDAIVEKLRLNELRESNGPWLGVGALIGMAVLIVHALPVPWRWLRERIVRHLAMRRGKRRLRTLTPKEKEFLRQFFDEKTKTVRESVDDGVIAGLERVRVVFQATDFILNLHTDFNIAEWAWDYLQKNPELLAD